VAHSTGPAAPPGVDPGLTVAGHGDETVATLRPTGWARFLIIAFLSLWLAGWAVGEVFVGRVLVAAAAWLVGLRGPLPDPGQVAATAGAVTVGLLLLGWFALWTAGGVAAMVEILRLTAGRDRIVFSPAGVRVEHLLVGRLGRRRFLPAERIRRVHVRRRDQALVAETADGAVPLTGRGSPAARRWLAERIAVALPRPAAEAEVDAEGMAAPPGWRLHNGGDGSFTLEPEPSRRRSAGCLAVVTLGLGAGAAGVGSSLRSSGSLWSPWGLVLLVPAALTIVAAAGVLWYLLGRTVLLVAPGRIERRRTILGLTWRRSCGGGTLVLARRVDGDGDEHFRLSMRDGGGGGDGGGGDGGRTGSGGGVTTLATTMNEPRAPLALGRFLARASGLPLSGALDADDVG
jgi:hypothetical protein